MFDIGYGLGSTALFAYIGGTIGSITAPVVGTVVGAGIGFGVDYLLGILGIEDMVKEQMYRKLLEGELCYQVWKEGL